MAKRKIEKIILIFYKGLKQSGARFIFKIIVTSHHLYTVQTTWQVAICSVPGSARYRACMVIVIN